MTHAKQAFYAFIPFIIVSLADIVCLFLADCTSFDGRAVARYIKPFLIPMLALAVGLTAKLFSRPLKTTVLLLCALGFHTAGDILLLFSGTAMFLAGMLAFLIGHIFYLTLIWEWFKEKAIGFKLLLMLITVAVAFILMIPFRLKGPLALAPLLYAMVVFALTSFSVAGLINGHKNALLSTIGGVLFCISDSMIALNAFAGINFTYRNFLIMLTYLVAQALIVCALALPEKGD